MCECVCSCTAACQFYQFCSVREGLSSINQEIQSGSVESLLKALCSEDVHLTGVIPENIQWYKDILLKSTKDKAEVSVLYVLLWSVTLDP